MGSFVWKIFITKIYHEICLAHSICNLRYWNESNCKWCKYLFYPLTWLGEWLISLFQIRQSSFGIWLLMRPTMVWPSAVSMDIITLFPMLWSAVMDSLHCQDLGTLHWGYGTSAHESGSHVHCHFHLCSNKTQDLINARKLAF